MLINWFLSILFRYGHLLICIIKILWTGIFRRKLFIYLDRFLGIWFSFAIQGIELRLHLSDVFKSLEAILLYEPFLIHVEKLPMSITLILNRNIDFLLWYNVRITWENIPVIKKLTLFVLNKILYLIDLVLALLYLYLLWLQLFIFKVAVFSFIFFFYSSTEGKIVVVALLHHVVRASRRPVNLLELLWPFHLYKMKLISPIGYSTVNLHSHVIHMNLVLYYFVFWKGYFICVIIICAHLWI